MAHNWSRKVLVRIDAAAVVDIAGADVEQGVAAEQRRLLGVGKQADVAHRVAGRVEAFQLHRLADLDDIASLHAPVDTGDLAARAVVGDQLGAGGRHAGRVAAGVVMVFMGIEQLGDLPAAHLGGRQTLVAVQRVDGQRLAGLGAGDEVVVVAVGVVGSDALDDHGALLWSSRALALRPGAGSGGGAGRRSPLPRAKSMVSCEIQVTGAEV